MSTSEIMTFSLVSALYFQCNYTKTRSFFKSHRYFSKKLTLSRINIRIHNIPELPRGSSLYADKGYNDYAFEDLLKEVGINLTAQRKSNSKRKHSGPLTYLQNIHRKRIETVFSQIISLMPRSIHARTAKGFLTKVFLFVLAFYISKI